jgi:hypothetical protein
MQSMVSSRGLSRLSTMHSTISSGDALVVSQTRS